MAVQVDVGDVHALLSVLFGGVAFCLTGVCCLDPWRDDEAIIVVISLVLVSLWMAAFGLVLRGTTATRVMAAGGLVLALTSAFIGLMTALLQ